MPAGLLAHVVTAGPGVLGLPTWALAYGMLMVVAVVALWLRSTLPGTIASQREVSSRTPRNADAPTSGVTGTPRSLSSRIGQVLSATVFLVMLGLAAVGPEQQGANPAPLLLFSLLWVGGAWLSLLVGSNWRAWSPLGAVADLMHRSAPDDGSESRDEPATPGAWWMAVLVAAGFAFLWVADPDGAQPRRIALAAGLFGVCAVIGAWRGGRRFLDRFDPFPIALSFTAWFRRDRSLAPEATRLGVAAMVAAAAVFNRVRATEAFGEWVGPRRLHAAQLQNTVGVLWLAAMLAIVVWGLGVLTDRLATGGDSDFDDDTAESDSAARQPRPGLLLTPMLGAIAGALVLTQTLNTFLVQMQNLAILASDPLAKGWDLFGTISWDIKSQPLGLAGAAWVQFALIAIGHAAALVVLRDRCVTATASTPSSTGSASRAWRAMTPGVLAVAASGVACTLGLLGS